MRRSEKRKAAPVPDVLINPSVLVVDRATYNAFVEALDAPPKPNPNLEKTMRSKPIWETSDE